MSSRNFGIPSARGGHVGTGRAKRKKGGQGRPSCKMRRVTRRIR